MKRVALLLALLLVPVAAQAFDSGKPETIRIAVLRSDDAIPVQLRNELRRAGFDAFTIDKTFEEIEQLEQRDADFYVEVITEDRSYENTWGAVGISGRNADVSIGVVRLQLDARVQVYDAQTLELLARFDLGRNKTAVAPTSIAFGGNRAYGWVGFPLGWMQHRSAKRAIAKDAAIKVAEVVREPVTPVVVLTTVGADFDAGRLARELVELRVAACVNIVAGVTSVYRWEGAVSEDGEQLLIIKTLDTRVDDLRDALFARHPYDVPEFVVLPVSRTSPAYGAWLAASATP